MARTKGSPLNPWTGKVGGMTYYVRHGKQIMYARTGEKRKPSVTERHKEVSAVMVAAHRWRKQLLDIGVDVPLRTLLNWAYAMDRVGKRGSGEYLISSSRGSWRAGRTSVRDGKVRVKATVNNAGNGQNGWLVWGDKGTSGAQPGFSGPWWYDLERNVYPSGTLWLSVVGGSMFDARLVIGRRVDVGGPYTGGKPNGPYSEVWQAWPSNKGVYLMLKDMVIPSPYDYVYWVDGWAAPSLILDGSEVLPFAILSADGTPLEMAVGASDRNYTSGARES